MMQELGPGDGSGPTVPNRHETPKQMSHLDLMKRNERGHFQQHCFSAANDRSLRLASLQEYTVFIQYYALQKPCHPSLIPSSRDETDYWLQPYNNSN